ncbi:DUF445 domain-containing protein [Alkalilimnicola sp. S0819]|uniref:DUF445 domain-containing protein n=1 Tax=Alkalilimnicola sp. S0819 TaxID=2613922 RepID=UPI001261744E|nr:DUF445 domain-containing protein [Alkalilimnicola sp. S0819]KAB7619647.1 DUF445 domain-containing protein [Alkalilimnicola sp. S0819]MPQ17585.1 DUF445 family protein [Alkalilimnicola sp. S0819]
MMQTDATRELAQQAQLRRHRWIATAFLLGAALLFVASFLPAEPGFWVLLLRAGAEAGVVGGIADWFAVTALFRHPFGIPIPHTAIIPRNKDRIGAGLGSFVETHFLVPELVSERLRAANPARRLGQWLRRDDSARLAADQILDLGPEVLNSFDDEEVRAFFRETFSSRLREVDPLPLLRQLLKLLIESRQHQRLFDRSLRIARRLLHDHQTQIYERVTARSSWWIPTTVDRKVARALVEGVDELLGELAQEGHPVRARFDASVAELVERLEHSASLRARVAQVQAQVLDSPELRTALGALWDELRRMLLAEFRDPRGALRQSLAGSLASLGRTLLADEAAQQRLNERLDMLLSRLVVPFRGEISALIRQVVGSWDAGTVSHRMELEVGRDLQFIRINGTLVGALVGAVLFLLTHSL